MNEEQVREQLRQVMPEAIAAQVLPKEPDPSNPFTTDPILYYLVNLNEMFTQSSECVWKDDGDLEGFANIHTARLLKFSQQWSEWFWQEKFRRLAAGLGTRDFRITA